MAATETPSEASGHLDPELVDTITAITEGDLLLVNDDTRTWEVTDVSEQSLEAATDSRQSKRVCRLSTRKAVFAIELVEFADHHEATFQPLETPRWAEANSTYDVTNVEILEQQVPWVVVTSGAGKYHFPDPQAAAFGEAAPVCGGGNQDAEYRIARISAVVPAYSGCKNCVRHEKPVELDVVACPECQRTICSGVLQGVDSATVDGLSIVCPECGFDGVVDVLIEPFSS